MASVVTVSVVLLLLLLVHVMTSDLVIGGRGSDERQRIMASMVLARVMVAQGVPGSGSQGSLGRKVRRLGWRVTEPVNPFVVPRVGVRP